MKSEQQLQELDIQNRVSEAYEGERYNRSHSRCYHVWWAEDMLASAPDTGLWLDLGCGTGWIQEVLILKKHQRRLIGIDISDGMLRFAQRKQMPVVLGDAGKLPFEDQSFDGVLAKGVLHHLPNMASAVAEIARVIKPGGVAVLVDPNLSPLRSLKYVLKNRDDHFSPCIVPFVPLILSVKLSRIWKSSGLTILDFLHIPRLSLISYRFRYRKQGWKPSYALMKKLPAFLFLIDFAGHLS
jgi:ubiquinone/menaquinone biosynthesis C-methylase UbiE